MISMDMVSVRNSVMRGLIPILLSINAALADSVWPYFIGGYPHTTNVEGNSIDLVVMLDEAGTVYYAALLEGEFKEAPSPQTILDMAERGVRAGSISAPVAEAEARCTLQGLQEKSTYSVFFVALDHNGNLQTQPTRVVETTADVTAPAFKPGFPRVSNIAPEEFTVEAHISEAGLVHYLLLPIDAPAPSVFQVLAGRSETPAAACGSIQTEHRNGAEPGHVASRTVRWSSTSLAGAGSCEETGLLDGRTRRRLTKGGVLGTHDWDDLQGERHGGGAAHRTVFAWSDAVRAGLAHEGPRTCGLCPNVTAGSHYRLFLAAEDLEGSRGWRRANNLQADVTQVEVRLGDWVAPVFAPGFPALANVRAFSADILVCADEPGTAFFLVVAANATQPSAAAVRRPDTYVGGTVHAHGRANLPARPDLAGTMRVAEGLQDGAAYDVYVVAEDAGNADTARSSYWSAAPNLQNYPTRLALRTPDGTPPAFEGDGPAAFAAGATSFRLTMRLSEPVQVFYMVLLADSPPPSQEQVRGFLHARAGGATAAACGVVHVHHPHTDVTADIVGVANPEAEPKCALELTQRHPAASEPLCRRCPVIDSEIPFSVYLLPVDLQGNSMSHPARVDVALLDTTPPAFEMSSPRLVANLPASSRYMQSVGVLLRFHVALSESATLHCLVLPRGSPVPSNAQVAPATEGDHDLGLAYGVAELARQDGGGGAEGELEVLGVPEETELDVWFVARDEQGNAAPRPTRVPVTSADVAAPEFVAPFPRVLEHQLTGIALTMEVQLNEPGVVYYAVLVKPVDVEDHDGGGIPSPDALRAGVGPPGRVQVAVGAITVPRENATFAATVVGLSPGTQYELWMAAEDDDHAGSLGRNLQASALKIDLTARDVSPPLFAPGHPRALPSGGSVEVSVMLSEPGRTYVLVVSAGSPAPSPAQVVALSRGLEGGDVAAAGGCVIVGVSGNCSIHGLENESVYDLYAVAEDEAHPSLTSGLGLVPNRQPLATKLQFTTHDVTPPTFTHGGPYVSSVSGTTAEVQLGMSEPGTAYFVAVVAGSAAPSMEAVRGGGGDGTLSLVRGRLAVAIPNTLYSGKLASLQPETEYDVYILLEDDGPVSDGVQPNPQHEMEVLRMRTLDVTPPAFLGPMHKEAIITNVGGHSFDINVQLDEAGAVYYLVRGASEAAPPSALAVKKCDLPGATACGRVRVPEAAMQVTASVHGESTPSCQEGSKHNRNNDNNFDRIKEVADDVCAAGQLGAEASLPLIESETDYEVWLVAEDDGGHGLASGDALELRNLQLAATLVAGGALRTADVTPPELVPGLVAIHNVTGDGFTLAVGLSEPGVVFFVVTSLLDASQADANLPSRAQIRSGFDSRGVAGASYGNVDVLTAYSSHSAVVRGIGRLSRYAEPYLVFMYAEDIAGRGANGPNQGAVHLPVKVLTKDVMPPLFESGYPRIDNFVSTTGYGKIITTFDISAKLDEPGTVFYAAKRTPDPSEITSHQPPSASQVRACLDAAGGWMEVCGSFGVRAPSQEFSVTTNDFLLPGCEYDVYVVALDLAQPAPNAQEAPVRVQVTTARGDAPLFALVGGVEYPFTANTSLASSAVVVAQSEPGMVCYLVLKTEDPEPTMAEVLRQGTDNSVHPGLSGCISIKTPNKEYQIALGRLPSTPYFVYLITVGETSNIGDGVVPRTALERPFKLPPSLVVKPSNDKSNNNNNNINNKLELVLAETSVTMFATLSAPGVVYYVVLERDARPPSALQVSKGMDANNEMPPGGSFADTSSSQSAGSAVILQGLVQGALGTVTNLTRGGVYKIYVVTGHLPHAHHSASGEVSRAVTEQMFTTLDFTAPRFLPGYPHISAIEDTHATVAVMQDEPGQVYYLVQGPSQALPSSHQVVVCTDGDGLPGRECGSKHMRHTVLNDRAAVSEGLHPSQSLYTLQLVSLVPNTEYAVFVVARDVHNNTQNLPVRLTATTRKLLVD